MALEPTPELIDVLWGYYLATGSYPPIERIIKLLPLANDKDNVDNLTTGSAAKFTLASNAVRDNDLLAMLKWSVKSQPKDVAVVLNDVIEHGGDRRHRAHAPGIARRDRRSSSRRARTRSASSRAGARSGRARCRWAASWPPRPGRSNWAYPA